MKKSILLILFLFSFCFLNAQKVILLLNGKKLYTKAFKFSDDNSILAYKNSRGKIKSVISSEIFSIVDSNKIEKIIYLPDTNINLFSVEEMRTYVLGKYDARNNYNAKKYMYGGIIVAGSSVICVPLIGLSTIYVPLFPLSYYGFVGLKKIKTEKLNIKTEYTNNEYYITGYKEIVRKKRMNYSLIGTGIGITVGIGIAAIIFNVK